MSYINYTENGVTVSGDSDGEHVFVLNNSGTDLIVDHYIFGISGSVNVPPQSFYVQVPVLYNLYVCWFVHYNVTYPNPLVRSFFPGFGGMPPYILQNLNVKQFGV